MAVVDLGSNSIRLVVYDALSRAPVSRFNEKKLCALGRVVAETGRLGSEGSSCAMASLRRFVGIARSMGCGTVDIIATAAVRAAEDGDEFAAVAQAALGEPVTVLSGPEEARLGALGVACGFAAPDGLSGDLGGGSVEFANVPNPEDSARVSLPVGALTLSAAMSADRKAATRMVDTALEAQPWLRDACRGRTFYVVGGSWRALARARMAMLDAPLRAVHGYELTPREAETLGRTIAGRMPADLAAIPGVPKRRVEMMPAAALLLERVTRLLRPARVVFSATGLREGRLYERLSATERAVDPLIAGAAELGGATNRLPGIGEAMQRWTDGIVADETPALRRLRHAACLLSDSAWREHPDSRAREAFFRLAQYPFLGMTQRERVLLAFMIFVRYQGRRKDPAVRRLLTMLDEPAKLAGEVVGEALDLGYRLSGGVPAILDACRLRRDGGELLLETGHPAVDPQDDSLGGRLRLLGAAVGAERVRAVGI
ncbi:hypothetical protein SH611_16130 [Geminicoccaceae bacterium 1502E]|nr:hypothetical protein [Geminicoccaceae bacterium 1502E]